VRESLEAAEGTVQDLTKAVKVKEAHSTIQHSAAQHKSIA
jgi:hypothetical protein